MWSTAFGSEEAKAAFTRARELAAQSRQCRRAFRHLLRAMGRQLDARWTQSAQEIAETFLREADRGRMPEAAIARRKLGLTRLIQGDFMERSEHLEEALRILRSGARQ